MNKLTQRYVAALLALVVVGSLIFNKYSPWWFTEIASNWAFIDFTIMVTYWICGIAFILLGLFMAYCVWKFGYSESRRAKYDPENPKLESWLTGITTVGVVIMLAPGLIVWDDYVNVPPDAMEVEVLGEQWTWKFRFPGEDGIFGTTDILRSDTLNPFGMRNEDPYGEDDILVNTNSFALPINRNIKVLLRSKDVLHDFWVPEIRAKMDMVPGMITYFWFEPTKLGVYEILCAELCGRGHHSMRGEMSILEEEEFKEWLNAQTTWAEMKAGIKPEDPIVSRGRKVAEVNGCFACHSMDGTQVVGPTWQGLWGREVTLADDTTVVADEAYVIESIQEPNAKMVKGFAPTMVPYNFEKEDMDALIRFLQETAPQSHSSEEASVEAALLEEVSESTTADTESASP